MRDLCEFEMRWRRGHEGVAAPPRAHAVLDGQPLRWWHAVGTRVSCLVSQCHVRPPKDKTLTWRVVWHSLTTRETLVSGGCVVLFGCWCHGDVPWMVEQEALIPVAQDNRLALPQLKTVELGVCEHRRYLCVLTKGTHTPRA